jgi:hypothetical protein
MWGAPSSEGQRRAAKALGEIATSYGETIVRQNAIVPVPMHLSSAAGYKSCIIVIDHARW